jgi:hypothetical protein
MKKIMILIGCLLLTWTTSTSAQSRWSVFIQQMTSMKAYLQSLKGVYKTTQKGLNTMHSLKDGSFTLNQSYFLSLNKMPVAIKNNAKINATTGLLQEIEGLFQRCLDWQQKHNLLSADEQHYMQGIYSHLLDDCNKDLQELTLVTNDGSTQMSDAARIKEINKIYTSMQDKHKFTCYFTANAFAFARSRAEGKNSKQTLQQLYGINK